MSHRLPSLPKELAPPARDILRGVRKALSAPIKLLEPVGVMVPERFQSLMHDITGGPGRAREAQAAAAMTPPVFAGSGDAPARFATVAYFGLSFALDRLGRGDLLISETVAGIAFRSAMSHCAPDAPASEKAAAVAVGMGAHHVIGRAPGTGIGMDRDDLEDSRLAIFVAMLWLLVERPESEADEAGLLAICFDVAASDPGLIAQAGGDIAKVSALLDKYSQMI